MKDFAKSIVCNTKVGNYSKDELLKYAKLYGDKELIDHINSGKMTSSELGSRIRWFQYQWDGKDINGKVVDKEKAGNSKVGNADPRIASLKAKIKQNKDDVGALKDVLSLAESMIKDLKARKEKLYDEIEKIDNDLLGWQEIKNEIKWN